LVAHYDVLAIVIKFFQEQNVLVCGLAIACSLGLLYPCFFLLNRRKKAVMRFEKSYQFVSRLNSVLFFLEVKVFFFIEVRLLGLLSQHFFAHVV
jgi:hypothetical protein